MAAGFPRARRPVARDRVAAARAWIQESEAGAGRWTEAESEEHMAELPLAGVRVVEVTVAQFGPQSSQHLADMGAEVVKIEPVGGAMARRTPVDSVAKAYFHSANRNKQSLA